VGRAYKAARAVGAIAPLVACLVLAAAAHAAPAEAVAGRVWLDELDLTKATTGWGKAQANKSVEGRPLTVAGQTFARGLGTHGPGVLRVQLDGAATRFTARVGIDDEVAGRPSKASAEFQVIADGKVLWTSGVMKSKDPAKEIAVDLAGVRQVDLVVTDGGDTYACDHADWGDAAFEVTAGAKIAAVSAAKNARPQTKAEAKSQPQAKPQGTHQPDPKITGTIDLAALAGAGAKVLAGFRGRPDDSPWGVLGTYELALPRFSKGVFYSHANGNGAGWPNMMNRGFPWPFTSEKPSIAALNDGGIFVVFSLEGGGYLAVTAVAGPKTQSWFHTDAAGRMMLSFGTFGTAEVSCDAPLFAWGRSDDLYEACRQAIAAAIASDPLRGRARLRGEKAYPEYFGYLGWCSWEHFKGKIDEQNLLGAIDGIEASGLPIRYVLIDDGHTSVKRGGIDSFKPRAEKFPNGWAPLLARRSPEKIRWMGLWHDFKGYSNGLSPENDFGEDLNRNFEKLSDSSLTVRNSPEASLAFYRAFMGSVKTYGFDFVKTDFQSAQLARLAGKVDNAAQRCAGNSQAFETALEELGLGLINCNWHNPVNFFNCRTSCVGRCSIDYSKSSTVSAKRHIWQSYGNILWLGQLAWGDHDMFHSSHEGVGRIMAVSKAMSGGPVYLSDAPAAFVADIIRPLCYADGRLLRPLAPAAPLPDSAFIDPCKETAPYRVIAPLAGGSAAVVACNLYTGKEEIAVAAKVAPEDYTHAGGMIQPYEGKWEVPAEGLVAYDWQARQAERLGREYVFELKGFADRLVHLCPIRGGWAVIGRTDKYLSPAAAEVVAQTDTQLVLRLAESGPLAVWSAKGTLSAEGLEFRSAGRGLWLADMPVGKKNLELTVTRR
jgi:hypothetical protein